jgi:exopolysaccharide biosynthesis predicted pyruvyltransferase EpsI
MNWITQPNIVALRAMQDDVRNTLKRLLGGVRECALVDFPDHANVGDSMIWLGELALLDELGSKVRYVCAEHDYDPAVLRRSLGPGGVVLIHGGGNFGTLYARHQRLRERVLADFSGLRTIQLPQSINFDAGPALVETQRLIHQHKDFTLLVRDQNSRNFATANFSCTVEQCPDMALMLGSLPQRRTPSVDYFILARTDKEKRAEWSSALANEPPASWRREDWLGPGNAERMISRVARRTRRGLGRVSALDAMWGLAFRRAGMLRLQRGMRTLSQGRVVLTDRLHAHVLCVLMGKPHVVLGDSHGKIRAFFDAYSSRLSPAPWRDAPDEALVAARALLQDAR